MLIKYWCDYPLQAQQEVRTTRRRDVQRLQLAHRLRPLSCRRVVSGVRGNSLRGPVLDARKLQARSSRRCSCPAALQRRAVGAAALIGGSPGLDGRTVVQLCQRLQSRRSLLDRVSRCSLCRA